MNTFNFKQRGHGVVVTLLTLLILALSTTIIYSNKEKHLKSYHHSIDLIANEVASINSSLLHYYRDNNSWPSNLNELVDKLYYIDSASKSCSDSSLQSSYCTTIFGFVNADNSYTIRFNAITAKNASTIANRVSSGKAIGNVLESSIRKPSEAVIYDDFLKRVADHHNSDKNILYTSIDVNNNNIDNIGAMNAKLFLAKSYSAKETAISEIDVLSVEMGKNKISLQNQKNLSFQSNLTEMNGLVSFNGNINMNGNNVNNSDIVTGSSITADSLKANSAEIESMSGTSMEFRDAKFDKLVTDEAQIMLANISKLSGNNIDFKNARLDNIEGANFKASQLESENVNINKIRSLNSNTVYHIVNNEMTVSKGDINEFNAAVLTANTANFSSLEVTNTDTNNVSSIDGRIVSLSSLDSSIDNLNTDNLIYSQLTFDKAKSKHVSSSGTSTIENIASDDVNSNSSIINNKATLQSGSAGNMTATSLDSKEIFSSDLSSRLFKANKTNIDIISAKNVSATSLSTNSTMIESAAISDSTINSTDANASSFSNLNLTTISAKNFSSTNDFITSNSSVNKNYQLMNSQYTDLNECINVTGFCIPKSPSILNFRCSNCFDHDNRSNFNATISATVTQCQRGCTYKWEYAGINGNCSSGTVAKNSSKNVSCIVSATLGPQESLSTPVKLIASNSSKPNLNVSKTANIDWFNNTVPFDLGSSVSHRCLNSKREDKCQVSTSTKRSEKNPNVTFYPLVDGKDFADWSSTNCPDCRWSYRVNSNTCKLYNTAYGSATITKRDGSLSATKKGPRRTEGGCAINYDITFSGRGQTATINRNVYVSWYSGI